MKPAAHPPTSVMVTAAISAMKDRKGSSLAAIKKYIAANYKVDVTRISVFIRAAVKKGVASGTLKQASGTGASGRFRMGAKPVTPKKKKAKKAKKPKKAKKAKKTKKAKKPKAKKMKAKKSPKKAAKPKKAKKAKKPAAKKAAKKPAAKKAGRKGKKSPKKAKKWRALANPPT